MRRPAARARLRGSASPRRPPAGRRELAAGPFAETGHVGARVTAGRSSQACDPSRRYYCGAEHGSRATGWGGEMTTNAPVEGPSDLDVDGGYGESSPFRADRREPLLTRALPL